MSHTSKRITALMLALTMISIFPATTALALETEPITAEMTAEQLDISTPETAGGAETEENTTATDDTAEAEENSEPAEELFDVQTAAEPVETAISVQAMPGANTGDDTVRPSAVGCTQRLLGISVNGDALENFKPEIFHYTYSLAKDETEANVTVQANTKTENFSHTMLNGHEMKEIRVYDPAKSSSRYTTYTIEIEPYSPYSPSQYSRYEVVGVQASSYQTDIGNIPEYSYDGDMSTRWSAEGVGEWIVHDLGEVKEIDAFGVAEWMGNQRKFYFDLQISDDGVNWTTAVADYATSGTSEDIEIIPLDTSVKARYVRYWGKGNSRNSWNNVIELATYVRRKHATTQPSPDPNPEPNPNPNSNPGTTTPIEKPKPGEGTATPIEKPKPGEGTATPAETPKPGEGTATPAPSETPVASGGSSAPGMAQGGSSASANNNTKSDTATIPRTADDSISPSALLVVMLVSFAAMACAVYVRRKNHK